MTPLTIAFWVKICMTYARASIRANGLVRANARNAAAATAAMRPAMSASLRPVAPAGRPYNPATNSGTASSTALNFDPTASPASAPASSHAAGPPPSARRTASARVAVTQKVSTASTAAKWLS